MYWLKTCPRCSGDLHDEQDHFGAYVACIQCGYVLAVEEENSLRATGIVEAAPATPTSKAA